MLQVIERLLALLLFLASSPFLLCAALLVAMLSRRSPFVAIRRVGWRGQIFWMLKLRTMWQPAAQDRFRLAVLERIEDNSGPPKHHGPDPRVTSRFAYFCRRSSLDEVPQLLHVMSGKMAFVGPRPLTAGELRDYYGADAEEILSIKPGLSGLWQIMGRNRLTYRQRKRLDLFLIRHLTLRMYAVILLRTIPCVLSRCGAW